MSEEFIAVPVKVIDGLKGLLVNIVKSMDKVNSDFRVPETAVQVLHIKDMFQQAFRRIDKWYSPKEVEEEKEELPPFLPLEDETSYSSSLEEIVSSLPGITSWKINDFECNVNLISCPGSVIHVQVNEDTGLCEFVVTLSEVNDLLDMEPCQILAAWNPKTLECTGTWLVAGSPEALFKLIEDAVDEWPSIPDQFFLANYPSGDTSWDSFSEDYFLAIGIEVDGERFNEKREVAIASYVNS